MLTVVKVFGIIGILLLCLIGFLLFLVLMALFSPVTYRIGGNKTPNEMKAWVKVRWFLGLFRMDYRYPKPNKAVVKFLNIVLFDSGKDRKTNKSARKKEKNRRTSGTAGNSEIAKSLGMGGSREAANSSGTDEGREPASPPGTDEGREAANSPGTDEGREPASRPLGMDEGRKTANSSGTDEGREPASPPGTDEGREPATPPGMGEGTEAPKAFDITADERGGAQGGKPKLSRWGRLKAAIHIKALKIKYTFLNLYDKIKDIIKNIDYYRELLMKEETRELYLHVKSRAGKLLRNIRPQKIKADIKFGTGSPDTTGYAIGICGMLFPYLGKYIHIEPNFNEAILLGEFYIAGHITGWVLLVNAFALFKDQRLKRFLKKMQREDK